MHVLNAILTQLYWVKIQNIQKLYIQKSISKCDVCMSDAYTSVSQWVMYEMHYFSILLSSTISFHFSSHQLSDEKEI